MKKRVSQIGKRVRDALYVHREALAELSVPVRRAVTKAATLAGEVEWNVARIEKAKIALLEYEDFETEHFPALKRSVLVDLPSGERKVRDYSTSTNPPILHRKEQLLPSDHPRRTEYAALTEELDQLGLFADNHKIGLRKAWQSRLDEAGIVVHDHRLVRAAPTVAQGAAVEVARHKTAIPRNVLSSPMQMFARHGFLDAYPDVFDYGCGQGDDLRALDEAGVKVSGWDPHFRPTAEIRPAALVNLGFVLNVIEFPEERRATLKKAWEMCRDVLAVAVMVEGHYSVQGLKPYGDGFLTARRTFQKYFSPHELRAFVRETLSVEPVAVAPGIVLVFRSADAEQEFLFRRRSRPYLPTAFRTPHAARPAVRRNAPLSERLRPTIEAYWTEALRLGRPPEADEVPEIARMLSRSNVSLRRALEWCRSLFDDGLLELATQRKRDDLLVHLALGAFSGSQAFKELPSSLRRDVKACFGSYAIARSDAQRLLFSLGDDEVVLQACRSALDAGIAHSSIDGRIHFRGDQIPELPPVLRGLVGCAGILVGDAEDADIVALNVAKRSVTFYYSPDFSAALTLFHRATTVYLRDQHVRDRVFRKDQRQLFLCRSDYESDPEERKRRASVEYRIKSVVSNANEASLTARYGDVIDSLGQRA